MPTNQRTLGIILALVSAVNFAFANTLAGIAYEGGTDPLTLSTVRYMLPALIVLLVLKIREKPVLMTGRANWVGIGLGVMTAIYNFALMSAINLLPVSIAILIFYLFPILTAVFLALFGWGRLTFSMIISAFVAFFGLALTLSVQFGELNKIGILFGLISAVGLAIVSTISNRIMRGRDSLQATFYMAAVATLSMIVVSIGIGDFNWPTTDLGWVGFVASHVLYAAAMIGFYASISMVGAAATTFFSNLEPIIVVGTGYLLLGQVLSPWQMVGVAIVVGALIYASRSGSDDTILDSRPDRD